VAFGAVKAPNVDGFGFASVGGAPSCSVAMTEPPVVWNTIVNGERHVGAPVGCSPKPVVVTVNDVPGGPVFGLAATMAAPAGDAARTT
jgi:hypothetical protein